MIGGMRRYPAVGGAAARWGSLLIVALVVYGALGRDAWGLALGTVVAAVILVGLRRSLVIEVSPDGLARGVILQDAFVAQPRAMAWGAVVDIHTQWSRPRDLSSLETTIRARDGATIRLSTAMGLTSYWACLADVVRHAPGANRSGLTEAMLAEGPPGRRDVYAAAMVAGVLALVLVALTGVFYVWAQGRSSLARYLEETGHPSASVRGAEP
ncbi:MAG TPA: hypothetical protein VLD61_01680 [Methylomirabilota bacterium]|nr:hypothetical protein [Methylomirabilota bacterium]